MVWNGLPLIIFGSGGISKEVYCLIKDINRASNQQIFDFLGFIGSNQNEIGNEIIDSHKIISSDEEISDFAKKHPLIGMVIPIGNPVIKEKIYRKVENIRNAVFPNIIHPSVYLNKENVELGKGNIITSGVNLTCDIKIGDFNLINLNSTIGHDTVIKDFNVINPLASISGNVVINDCCLIGTGAQVLQGLVINRNSIVGGGAVVVKNVESDTTVVGIPAKPLK